MKMLFGVYYNNMVYGFEYYFDS